MTRRTIGVIAFSLLMSCIHFPYASVATATPNCNVLFQPTEADATACALSSCEIIRAFFINDPNWQDFQFSECKLSSYVDLNGMTFISAYCDVCGWGGCGGGCNGTAYPYGDCWPYATQACTATGPVGNQCPGTKTCGYGGVWGSCQPGPSCNECSDGQTMPCYDGPAGTQGIGICLAGVNNCVNGLWDTTCQGQVLPQVEICDNLDNDCNGIIDNGFECKAGDTIQCYSGPAVTQNVGTCRGGTKACINCQWDTICQNEILPEQEKCDGKNHNCNDKTNEGCDECKDDSGKGTTGNP